MARLGLGPRWDCLLANDFDPKKAQAYRANFGPADELLNRDVATVQVEDVPGAPDLVWASFPCQDLSLAGAGAGLRGSRSGTFWPFWRLVRSLCAAGRGPSIVALENVCGTLSSHGGADFAAIADALSETGYRFGALVIDAAHFVPQSRPRLFVIGVRDDLRLRPNLLADGPDARWHPSSLLDAISKFSPSASANWVWWSLPAPPPRTSKFIDLLEDCPGDVAWHTRQQTETLLAMMSPLNRRKISNAQALGHRVVGGIYKRTRIESGTKVQRAEVRFDDVAGCLRTPSGGSSRQSIVVVEGDNVKSRLLSAREAARLMGIPNSYLLPNNYNAAYHIAGDGVVVPVVRYLAENIFEAVLARSEVTLSAAE